MMLSLKLPIQRLLFITVLVLAGFTIITNDFLLVSKNSPTVAVSGLASNIDENENETDKLPICRSDQYKLGKWEVIDEPYDSKELKYRKSVLGTKLWVQRKCDCADITQSHCNLNRTNYRPRVYAKWRVAEDAGCDLVEFSETRFCEMMKGLNILYMGDSLVSGQFSSFMTNFKNIQYFTSHQDDRIRKRHKNKAAWNFYAMVDEISDSLGQSRASVCDGSVKMMYLRTEKLHDIKNMTEYYLDDENFDLEAIKRDTISPERPLLYGGFAMKRAFSHYNLLRHFDVVFFSQAVEKKILKEIFKDELKYKQNLDVVFRRLKQKLPHLKLNYINSVPGHPGCEHRRFSHPFQSVHEAEDYISDQLSNTSHPQYKYNWHMIKHINQITQEFFTEMDIDTVDIYSSLVMRSDSRLVINLENPDCLHYCFAHGPNEHSAKVVYNYLLRHVPKWYPYPKVE